MPELPEVETIRRGLQGYILNKKIVQIDVREAKMAQGEDISLIRNQKVLGLRRFGKALVIDFANRYSMMVHLRMTGQLIWRGEECYAAGHPSENFIAELPNKQTRIIFVFEDGKLFFNDQRKFGFVKILKTAEVQNDAFIAKLALEPWEMTTEELLKKFKKHAKITVKAALLDQKIICGLGNIYADESLFYAGIHPATKAGDLNFVQVEMILRGARKVMEDSINSGGSTMATYVKADGTRGNYLDKFAQVFGKEGTPCPKCGTIITKIRVAGRGTHVCSECQK